MRTMVTAFLLQPCVRVATAKSVSDNPSLGIFDLLNPLSAVLLSQFVLGLSRQVDALSGSCFPSVHIGSDWRADQTDLRSLSASNCCLRPMSIKTHGIGSIESWVGSISTSIKTE